MACRNLAYYNNTELKKVGLKKELTLKYSLNTAYSFYLFGFNGMEKDDEVHGVTGTSYTTQFRQYDPRIARWLSIDPKEHLMPWQSPYTAFDNSPLWKNDPQGDIAPVVIYGLYLAGEALFYTITAYYVADQVAEGLQKLDYDWERSDGQVFNCYTGQPFNEGGNMKFGDNKDPKGTATVIGGLIVTSLIAVDNYRKMDKQLEVFDGAKEKDSRGVEVNTDILNVLTKTSKESKEVIIDFFMDNKEMTDEAASAINNTFNTMIEYSKDDIYLTPSQVNGLLNPDRTMGNAVEDRLETLDNR